MNSNHNSEKKTTDTKSNHENYRSKDDLTKKQKVAAIKKTLKSDPVDVDRLRQLAISRGGLINDELRRQCWPKLLNVNIYGISKKPENLKEHRDYNQVVLDVARSLKRFPPGMRDEQRLVLQDQLIDVIMRVLVKNPELHYYQGYHDICVTFLLIVSEDIAFALVDQLSTNHLRDFMEKTMEKTTKILSYLYPILGKANPELREFMELAETGTIFCLSWLITWFGHVLSDFRHVVRLYDFFLACHPMMPIYVAAAIVLYRQEEVLQCECDMAMIHSLLSKIPDGLPYEQLISKAGDLYLQYPPEKLEQEANLQLKKSQEPDSVLKARRRQKLKEQQERRLVVMNRQEHGSRLVKVTVWALTAAVGVAAYAVMYAATDLNHWWYGH
ncbi:TBC1 domain family member 20 isoform X2 [Lingula anatina]|uniref:TBC1 domain family member 20 n=1 Tax=Lingula anatina TaxID=7574 RepID=A0A1S3ICT5_LINAN|nr:TBC1 domain family member 20 isoform X2 [Lingula anatina]|eukprot:XP_013395671.1 TBC1 domain family member 20 isoform X2 [Lingula anatina]